MGNLDMGLKTGRSETRNLRLFHKLGWR